MLLFQLSLLVLECGPHIDVENAKVYGNRREVGSKLKYVCTTSSVTAIVKCGKNGSWTTQPVCRGKFMVNECDLNTYNFHDSSYIHHYPLYMFAKLKKLIESYFQRSKA